MKLVWRMSTLALMVLLTSMLACNFPFEIGPRAAIQEPSEREVDSPLPSSVSSGADDDLSTPEQTTSPGSPRTSAPAGPTIEDLMVACPSPEEVASVDADLRLEFVNDLTAGTLVCTQEEGSVDLTLFEKNLYHAILAMRWIEFDAPLPWTELSLYNWFVQAVNGVRVDSDEGGSYCCTDGGLVVIAPKENFFTVDTDRFLRDTPGKGGGINGVDTLMLLLAHEARHNEGYPHTCDQAGNDATLAEMGSWAIVYYLNVWLADRTDPEFMRSDLNSNDWYEQMYAGEANWMLNYRFCDEPSYTPSP